jgi:ABC-2 type transport system permease protein
MFKHILKFELRYWFRQPMLYIFILINAALIFGASSSDSITVGSQTGNVNKNAPFVVEQFYSIMSLFSLLMITAFLNSAAARDFMEKTSQILFTTPIKKRDFILGRFFGAVIICMIPFLGVSIGNLIGVQMPWLDESLRGPTFWSGHIHGFLIFVVPNMFFAGAVIFSIAALTRSTILSFVGSIGLLVGYIISQNLIRDIDSEVIGAMLDPFGMRTFSVATKYWTVDDKNTMSMGFEGLLLMNRLIWMGVGVLVLIFTYYRFSFSEKSRSSKRKAKSEEKIENVALRSWVPLISVKPIFNSTLTARQIVSQVKLETISILKNTAFIVIMIFGAINLISSMSFATSQGYGLTAFPVTYQVLDIIEGSFYLFIVAVITFYSGVIVWKERDNKVSDIYDALPYSDWMPLISKMIALWLVIETLLIIGCLIGIITQILHGFGDIRLGVYLIQMIVISGLSFLSLIALSVFIHILVNNKYLGYFIFVAFVITNNFVWPALDVETNLIPFGSSPSLIYSDMNKFGPFLTGTLAFEFYWLLFSIVLLMFGFLFWIRGRDVSFKIRTTIAKHRFPMVKLPLLVALFAWIVFGSFLYYNSKVLNEFTTSKEDEKSQADYEKTYKRYELNPQPRVVAVEYQIDLFPVERRLDVKSTQWIKNKSTVVIDSIFFTVPNDFEFKLDVPSAKLVLNDSLLQFQIYRLNSGLQPGDSLLLTMSSSYQANGIENEVSNTNIVSNGSFFNNSSFLPMIGYQANYEIQDKNDRKKKDLAPRKRMPLLSKDPKSRMDNYISNNSDWVTVITIFSTSEDQIAIAPGSLKRQWKKDGRSYFEYELDHYSLNFYSFLSARFETKRKMHKGISLEVYYDKAHPYNVDKMLMSMEKAIDYYTENFGPYAHKQARIIEFPRYASFAQAFPGTMPYSESIGFIANLEDSDDIDMVTYVVAHEMGHQWWAHQVMGPEMQGSTLLSESMAQYSALMVMEKMYGKDQMHKFLRYEMDRYLRSRGTESEKECALEEVENQGYVHYNKASVIMYYFKEMVGEKNVNAALKNLVDSFAYRQPPYPGSYELVDRFEAATPDSLKYLITDLFKKMTIFNNRVLEASSKKVKDGYETTFKVRTDKMYADSLGKETKIGIHDWIEIGVFAKPAEGKKMGKALHLKKVLFDKMERSFTIHTKDEPYQVGVDPYYYLIDRVPSDNLKKITMN